MSLSIFRSKPGQLLYGLSGCFIMGLAILFHYITHPKLVFQRRKHPQERVLIAAALASGNWTHSEVVVNNVPLHVVSCGPKDAPVLVFIHGFPEFWYSWRHQLVHFSKNYRCIALDLRGYGESGKPKGKENYDAEILGKDIDQLLQKLEIKKVKAVIGHDWGAIVSYSFATQFPEKLENLIILNGPHPKIFMERIFTYPQILKSFYIFAFQIPFLPELLYKANDYGSLKVLFGKLIKQKKMEPEDLEYYKHSFSQPNAITSAMNYYRQILNSQLKWVKKINTPTLVIWGTKDKFLPKSSNNGLEKICTNIQFKEIPDASHWIQFEKSKEVNAEIEAYLKKSL